MVVILADHCRHVAFPPFLEVEAVIIVGFHPVPHIECFVHHVHAQTVAGAQHRRRHRLMGHPDCVEAGFLQPFDLTELGVLVRRRPEQAAVVVDAGAAEFHRFAVHAQAAFRVHLQRPDAESRLRFVQQFPLGVQLAFASVQARRFVRPASRIFHGHALLDDAFFLFEQHKRRSFFRHFVPVRIADHIFQHQLARRILPCLHFRRDVQHRQSLVGFRRFDLDPFRHEMRHIRNQQVDITVDAPARVPAAVRHRAVADLDADFVLFAVA